MREKGVKPDVIVGIMVERSLEMIVGILATLKAGGAYLPIDPLYPAERIQYILENSEAEILIIKDELKEEIQYHGKVVLIDDINANDFEGTNLNTINKPDDLSLYNIYFRNYWKAKRCDD